MRCLALVDCDWGKSQLPTYCERYVLRTFEIKPVWKIRRMDRVDFCYAAAATSNLWSWADGYVRPLSFGLAFLR